MSYFKKKLQKGGKAEAYNQNPMNVANPTDYDMYGREDIYPYRPDESVQGKDGTLDTAKSGQMLNSILEQMKLPDGSYNDVAKYVGELVGRRLIPDEKMPELIDMLTLRNDGMYAGDPTQPSHKDRDGYAIEGKNTIGVDPDTYNADAEYMPKLGNMYGKYNAISTINQSLGLPQNQESIMDGSTMKEEMANRSRNTVQNVKTSEEADRILGKGKGYESVKSKIVMDGDEVLKANKAKKAENKSYNTKSKKDYEKEYPKKEQGGKVKVYAQGGKLASKAVQDWYEKQPDNKKLTNTFRLNGKTYNIEVE